MLFTAAALAGVILAPTRATAQELEPRVYLASPVGTNVVVVAVARSSGDVVADPTVPIKGAHARIGVLAGAYLRSFDFFGRSASVSGTFPLLRGRASAPINGEEIRVDRFGQGDVQARLTVNLAGSPAMDLRTFAKRGRHLNFGASLLTVVPVGQYDATRLVNLGSNRWAYKPELGLSAPFGQRWLIDTYFGTWFFGDNDNYLGQRRSQAPLYSTQLHLSYNLSLRSWAAFDATFYAGGRMTVGGTANLERQQNTRLGGTLSLPFGRRQSVRVNFSRGARVRLGSNFTTIGVSWNYAWGRGL